MNDSRQDLDGLQRREREHLAVWWPYTRMRTLQAEVRVAADIEDEII